MTSLISDCMPSNIFAINEIKEIALKSEEQAAMVFGNAEKGISVLCGESFSEAWTIVPPINRIIEWIYKTKTYFREAIIIHNHPFVPWYGEIIPSDDDIAATEILKWQLALLGIKLLDHIIISGHKKRSLLEIELYNNSYLKINGFEIKRFLYYFLVQVTIIIKDLPILNHIITLLESNLARIKNYYDKPHYIRIFKGKPKDIGFIKSISNLRTADKLISNLINVLKIIEDDTNIKIYTENIIPYGFEFQKRIISSNILK